MTEPLERDLNRKTESSSTPAVQPPFGWRGIKTIAAALVISCIVLISLYIRVPDYGFYEDDYWAIVPYFKAPVSELWNNTYRQFLTWTQGRPLNHCVPPWFSRVGYGLGGLQGIYFLGFLVQSLNAFLVYLLLRKWLDHWSAILGGCLFVLLPVDTTHIFLEHSAQLHMSLTYILVGLLINRTRFWLLSYPIAALSLLSYETAFLPFIAFPLFFVDRKKRLIQWLTHLVICGAVLLTVFGIRLHLSDARATSVVSQPTDTLWRMVSSLWLGPETSLRILAKAVLQAPHSVSPFAFFFAGLGVILLLLVLRLPRELDGNAASTIRLRCITLFCAGVACWVFAYFLTITNYPPTQETGRLTSTHLAAVFGLTCAIAAVTGYFRSFADFRPKATATGIMTCLVALFILYAFHIQNGFAAAWTIEKRFWREVVELCPDLTIKTRVILVGIEPAQDKFIQSNSWADPLVLGEIFTFSPAPIFFYYDGMGPAADIRFENGQVTWKPFFWEDKRETLDLGDLIILQDNGEQISRIPEYRIAEIPFPLHSKELATDGAQPAPKRLSDFGRFLLLDRR